MAQLRLELKKSEVNRLQLLAQLREYQAIRVEPGVSDSEDVMKYLHVNEIVGNCLWMLLQWNLSKTPPVGQFKDVAA